MEAPATFQTLDDRIAELTEQARTVQATLGRAHPNVGAIRQRIAQLTSERERILNANEEREAA